jgi:hypothetical protein
MKVIKFAPGLVPVLKHGEHDQASHGNWATGELSGEQKAVVSAWTSLSNKTSWRQIANDLSEGKTPNASESDIKTVQTLVNTIKQNGVIPSEALGFAASLTTGLRWQGTLPKVGDNLKNELSSATIDERTAERFSQYSDFGGAKGKPVVFHYGYGTKGLDVNRTGADAFADEKEWLVSGTFEVTDKYSENGITHVNLKPITSVKKHGTHDQKDHGNWATDSQGSASELSDSDIQDIIHNTKTIEEMYQKVAERLGKTLKPKVAVIPEGEENLYRGMSDLTRDSQQLIDGKIRFTPFQTWGQGIYATPSKQDAESYGQVVRMKLDDSAKILRTESEAFSVDTSSTPFKSDFIDFPRLLPKITSGEIDNFSVSDAYNIYWAAKGYDGYQPHGGEIVLFNGTHLTVNKTDIGSAVKKHQEHDQSSHGNWAEGSEGSDSMPYAWNPKIKRGLDFVTELSATGYKVGKKELKDIAESPIAIRIRESKLDLIVADGRFKSLSEKPDQTSVYEMNYLEARNDLEKGLWGVPENAKSPIYGFIDSPLHFGVDNMTRMYGDVKIVLKDTVSNRTTITAGDSANHGLIPVRMSDARNGNLTNEQVHGAYISRAFQRGADTVSQPVTSMRGKDKIDYFEAQIHGGVTLNDIKSVRLSKYSIVTEDTITALKEKGIEVIQDD